MEDQLADILAICIEKLEKGEATLLEILAQYPEQASELEPMLRLVDEFRHAPSIVPEEHTIRQRRVSLTKMLRDHNTSERESQGFQPIIEVTKRLGIGLKPVLARALIVGILAILGSAATVQAAQQAMPDSVLYPVKIGAEKIQLALADDQKALELQVEFAENRNQEIIYLNELEQYDKIGVVQEQFNEYVDEITGELAENSAEENQSGNADIAANLDETLQKHVEVLQDVLTTAPDQAKPAIERAIEQSSKQIDNLNHGNKEKTDHSNNGNNTDNDENDQEDQATSEPTVTPTVTQTPVTVDIQNNNPNSTQSIDATKTSPKNENSTAEPTKDKPGKP